jgi:hypothetical protein
VCLTFTQDNNIDVFPIAFLHVFFGAGGLPSIDLANVSTSYRYMRDLVDSSPDLQRQRQPSFPWQSASQLPIPC